MKLLYVAGPYRSPLGVWGVKQNIERAAMVARQLWLAGYAVICPHLNTAFMDGTDTDNIFLAGDIEILRRCDGIVMAGGWQDSKGACAEREFALGAGIPVFYSNESIWLRLISNHFHAQGVLGARRWVDGR